MALQACIQTIKKGTTKIDSLFVLLYVVHENHYNLLHEFTDAIVCEHFPEVIKQSLLYIFNNQLTKLSAKREKNVNIWKAMFHRRLVKKDAMRFISGNMNVNTFIDEVIKHKLFKRNTRNETKRQLIKEKPTPYIKKRKKEIGRKKRKEKRVKKKRKKEQVDIAKRNAKKKRKKEQVDIAKRKQEQVVRNERRAKKKRVDSEKPDTLPKTTTEESQKDSNLDFADDLTVEDVRILNNLFPEDSDTSKTPEDTFLFVPQDSGDSHTSKTPEDTFPYLPQDSGDSHTSKTPEDTFLYVPQDSGDSHTSETPEDTFPRDDNVFLDLPPSLKGRENLDSPTSIQCLLLEEPEDTLPQDTFSRADNLFLGLQDSPTPIQFSLEPMLSFET